MSKSITPTGYADGRLLRIYIYYRVLLAALLLALFTFAPNANLGEANPFIFLCGSIAYLSANVLSLTLSHNTQNNSKKRTLLLLIIDLFALGIMLHATGGLTAQFSVLFVVTVAAGNILLTGRWGAFVAAIASITILYEQFFFAVNIKSSLNAESFAQASLLGISFFAAALFSQLISLRMRQSEELAEQQAKDIEGLQELNQQIIERMRTGIIVVDRKKSVLLINDAAKRLLALSNSVSAEQNLTQISPQLDQSLITWYQNSSLRPSPFRNNENSSDISVSFAFLKKDSNQNVLIFLEDASQMTQQAQHLKLASLGRLAASIAHEVRNPLGAISHATQLLAESPDIAGPDRRLLDIVEQQCRRMNGVIENVLQMSRRQISSPELLNLKDWLDEFFESFQNSRKEPALIGINCPDDLFVRFDPRQLDQVITNLVTNGLRYSLQATNEATLTLNASFLDIDGLPYLDIIDQGHGISAERREHLFEPFYTTENTGTGLGLFLSKELCESNRARLDCVNKPLPGACFRITFAHPNRVS